MKLYNLKDIADILKFKFIGNPQNEFNKLLIDSRKIVPYNNSLFFAFKGKQHDGHIFIKDLYNKEVRSFVVSNNIKFDNYPEASFILVNNTADALQKIASVKRNSFNNPLIAITGSNGKTIVKEWLYHLLSVENNISRSPKSYNSQLGVPLSIWMIDDQSDLAIIEAGISKPGEMEKLEKIITPDIGILTNIGSAHQSNFKDRNEKLHEKLKLFKNCKTVICNHEHRHSIKNEKVISWSSEDQQADIYNIKNTIVDDSTLIKLRFKNKEYKLKIPFTDFGSISNAITCFSYLSLTGDIEKDRIIERFESLPGIQMRLETLDAINNSILINDSYNSDINSLEIALDYLIQKKGNKSTCLIMSDILQNSSDSKKFYAEIADLIKSKQIDRFIGIGKSLFNHKDLFETTSDFYLNTEDFIENIKYSDFITSAILLKGARDFRFEEISKRLQSKTHESYLETDMNLMRNNLLYFKSLLKPETKIMAMVKAFSYGSGYREVAAFLQHNRIDYLAVAYTDEGIELRNDGITTPVMVMNPSARDFNRMIEFGLEPEIYSLKLFKKFSKEIANSSIDKFPVHLKINTGMNRLGINSDEISELCKLINIHKNIEIKSIFSHLSGSDNKDLDYFTHEQASIFEKAYNEINNKTGLYPVRHILNSAGINRFPGYQFEMVRLGIGLYGLMPELSDKINQISVFKSLISQIHRLEPGDTVSYNRSGKIQKESRIATIPVGYADGIDRRLGNGNWYFIINGQKAYTIGNICMDMCMVDITGVDAKESDEVIVFGPQNNLNLMADILETIPYEVISGISQRVKRIYTEE